MLTNNQNSHVTVQLACFLCCLLFGGSLSAQTMIQGSVVDEAQAPLPFANVLLLNASDSSFVSGTVTDDGGMFELSIRSEQPLMLSVQLLGYTTSYTLLSADQLSAKRLSPIVLSEGGIELSEVEVTAEKPFIIKTIDRTIVNLENRLVNSGASVLDLLEQLPGVIVDRQNQNISILGKDGVNLLINGRQQYLNSEALFSFLAGMNSDNLQTVELITIPPANFDAQGNAGFINLQLKRYPGDGLNGNYALTAGFGNGAVFNGSFDLNFRKGPLAIAFGYSGSFNTQDQFSSIERRVGTGENFIETNTDMFRDPGLHTHNSRLIVDYQLSEQTSVGGTLVAYGRFWDMDAQYEILFEPANGTDTLVTADLYEENQWRSLQGNLNFNHKFSDKASMSADFDYLWYDNSNPIRYDFSYQLLNGDALPGFNLWSDKESPFNIRVGKIDYQHQLTNAIQVSTGIKASHSSFENDARVLKDQVTLPAFSSLSDLSETIGAAYAQVDYKLSEKIQFKGGLRYEHTDTELKTVEDGLIVDRNFGQLFPTFYALIGNFNFSYAKRINRPSFRDMAPFQIFVDPSTSMTGNPALQPSISHSVNASYRWKILDFNLGYTREDSALAFFQNLFDPISNTQTIMPTNLQKREFFSFSVACPFTFSSWWSGRANVALYSVKAVMQEARGKFSFSQNIARFNLTQSFQLARDVSVEINGFYRTTGLNGNVRTRPFSQLDFGIRKKLANDGQLTFSITDFFNSLEFTGVTDLPEENIYIARLFDFSNRTFQLTYRQSFGDQKVKEARRGREAEERRRIN